MTTNSNLYKSWTPGFINSFSTLIKLKQNKIVVWMHNKTEVSNQHRVIKWWLTRREKNIWCIFHKARIANIPIQEQWNLSSFSECIGLHICIFFQTTKQYIIRYLPACMWGNYTVKLLDTISNFFFRSHLLDRHWLSLIFKANSFMIL